MIEIVLALLGGVVGVAAGAWLRQRRYQPSPTHSLGWSSVLMAGAATAVTFGLLAWRADETALLLGVAFVTGGVIAMWTDLDAHRLPDWLTLPLAVVLLGILVVDAAVTGSWVGLATALLATGAVALLLLVWAIFGSLGTGDVKLGLSVGLVLGYLGWPDVLRGLLFSALISMAWAIVLLAMGRSKKSYLPMGPALILGVVSCLVW